MHELKGSKGQQGQQVYTVAEAALIWIPRPSTCIVDGMSLVQKIHGENQTFGEVSESLFLSALQTGSGSDRIEAMETSYI